MAAEWLTEKWRGVPLRLPSYKTFLKSDSNKYKKLMFREKTQMTHMWKMTYVQK